MTKAFKVERRGRPKKPGNRYPCGKLVTDREIMEARVIAFKQPHRQEAPENKRHDPKATWPLGILNLNGAVSDIQYQAAVMYGGTVRRYRAHYLADVPDPSPSSIAGFMEPKRGGGAPMNPDDARKLKVAYDEAIGALLDVSQRAAKVVARMAVFGERCLVGYEADLKRGLDALVSHYGIGRRGKS
jgi:hypothetical protein